MNMKNTAFKISRIILLAAAVLFFLPMAISAQDNGHDRDNHHDRQAKHDMNHHLRHALDHGKRDKVVARHDDYREVIVNDRHFFYRGGAFYERGANGYVVATAPIGARIDVLPGGYAVIRRHGIKYFSFGGIYYKFLPHERAYVVVSAPL